VTFPNLNSSPFGGEDFQTNLIMPEPCPFLSRKLPPCSIIRPTETKGIATGVVNFLTAMGRQKMRMKPGVDSDAQRKGHRTLILANVP
jgi:hypothetical protein